MKLSKIILTGVLATALTGVSFAANTVNDTTTLAVVYDEQAPQEIQIAELPEAIQETLKENSYLAERAYVLDRDGSKVYQVEVKKGAERMTLMYDENGEEITE